MSFNWVLDRIEICGLWRSSQHLKLLVLLLKPLLNHFYFVTGSIILLNIFLHWYSSLWQELVFWLCLQKKHVKCLNVKLEQPLFTWALKKVAFCPPTHTTAFWFMLFEVDHLNVLGNDISTSVINSSSFFLKKAFEVVSTLPSSQWELGELSSGCEGVSSSHIYYLPRTFTAQRRVSYPSSWNMKHEWASFSLIQFAAWA